MSLRARAPRAEPRKSRLEHVLAIGMQQAEAQPAPETEPKPKPKPTVCDECKDQVLTPEEDAANKATLEGDRERQLKLLAKSAPALVDLLEKVRSQ